MCGGVARAPTLSFRRHGFASPTEARPPARRGDSGPTSRHPHPAIPPLIPTHRRDGQREGTHAKNHQHHPRNRPKRTGTQPGAPPIGGRTMDAVPIAMPPPARDPNHLRPREFDSRSVLQGYPIRVHPAFDSASAQGRIRSRGTTLRPASQISTRPPLQTVAGAPRAGPTVSVNPRPPPHPHASSRSSATRLCEPTDYLKMLPPLPDPIASSPVHPKAPYVRHHIPFCSRSPMGDRSCCLVLPLEPGGLSRPAEPSTCLVSLPPTPRDGRPYECTILCRGEYPGRRRYPWSGARPLCSFLRSRDWFLRFRRGTPLPRKPKAFRSNTLGQTDGLQVFATVRVR